MNIQALRDNNSGVVLVTVIILTIVLSVVVVGILGTYISQITSSKSVVDTIRAEQLATGVFYQQYQAEVDGCKPSCSAPAPESLNQVYSDGTSSNKTFTTTPTLTNNNSGPNQSDPLNVTVSY